MKGLLRISILLNAVFLSTAIWMAIRMERSSRAPVIVAHFETNRQPAAVASATPVNPVEAKPGPFRWSQLESPDYPTYVANLRAIGCPEQTLRDIISADVDTGIFAPRREQLRLDQPAAPPGSASATLARHNLESGLQALAREENEFIAALLGSPEPTASSPPAPTQSHPRYRRDRAPALPIALPVVFQELDPNALKLRTNQIQAMADLKQSFIDEIGGPNQDSDDPAYLERWRKAQPEINDRLKAIIGQSAYETLEFQAQSAALAAAQTKANPEIQN